MEVQILVSPIETAGHPNKCCASATYILTIRQRYGRTDGRTDDLRSRHRALHNMHRAVKIKP